MKKLQSSGSALAAMEAHHFRPLTFLLCCELRRFFWPQPKRAPLFARHLSNANDSICISAVLSLSKESADSVGHCTKPLEGNNKRKLVIKSPAESANFERVDRSAGDNPAGSRMRFLLRSLTQRPVAVHRLTQ